MDNNTIEGSFHVMRITEKVRNVDAQLNKDSHHQLLVDVDGLTMLQVLRLQRALAAGEVVEFHLIFPQLELAGSFGAQVDAFESNVLDGVDPVTGELIG